MSEMRYTLDDLAPYTFIDGHEFEQPQHNVLLWVGRAARAIVEAAMLLEKNGNEAYRLSHFYEGILRAIAALAEEGRLDALSWFLHGLENLTGDPEAVAKATPPAALRQAIEEALANDDSLANEG